MQTDPCWRGGGLQLERAATRVLKFGTSDVGYVHYYNAVRLILRATRRDQLLVLSWVELS